MPILFIHFVMEIQMLVVNPFCGLHVCNGNLYAPRQPILYILMEIQMIFNNHFYTLCNGNPDVPYQSILYIVLEIQMRITWKSTYQLPTPSIYYVMVIQMLLTNPFYMEIHLLFTNQFSTSCNGNPDAFYQSLLCITCM